MRIGPYGLYCTKLQYIFNILTTLPFCFGQALVDFTDFQIYQELIKGREANSFYKSCVSEMLRLVMEEGCITRGKVLNYLGERFRVKMNLPEWYTHEQCANYLLE